MTGRLNPVLAMAAAALLAAPILLPNGAVQAQAATEDYPVLIVDFFAADAQDRGFGEKAANELRKTIASVPGYAPVDRGKIQEELRKYNLKFEELDCSKVRQLGSPQLMAVRVAFCVNYTSEGENRKVADIEVWDLRDNQSFPIAGFTVARNQQQQAAAQIFSGFDTFIKQLNATSFCAQYAESSSWEDALRNCDQALALNPKAVGTTFMKANILRSMNRNADALVAVEKVVELDPVHEDALQLAGFLATQLNQVEKGRQYYRRYLELNPGDAGVRNNIAYAIFEAGDPEGAMQFVEDGLVASNNDVALLTAHAIYAFQAADKEARATAAENSSGTVSPRVAELYRKAAGSFEKVFAAKGDSTDVSYLRNTVTAYIQLQDFPNAIRLSETFMVAYPRDTELLSKYSQALEKANRVDDALAALKKIEGIDANYANLYPRMGGILLGADRIDEAIPMLRQAVDKGANANAMARVLLGPVTSKAMKTGAEDWPLAIRILEQAKEFPVTPEQMQEFDFYHGYAIFQRAAGMQPPQTKPQKPPTPEVARATQPMFQRARQLLLNSRPWANQNNMATNVAALISASDQYLEIMDTVLKRAGPGR